MSGFLTLNRLSSSAIKPLPLVTVGALTVYTYICVFSSLGESLNDCSLMLCRTPQNK